MMTTKKKANLMLLIATLFWGSSYLFMQMGMATLAVCNFIALRFGLAFILAAACFPKRVWQAREAALWPAVVLGSLLLLVFIFILFGIPRTTTSNAAFLVSLTVIFVPLLTALLSRKLPQKSVVVGVGCAFVGVCFLTLQGQLSVNWGDVLSIGGALAYALHILTASRLTKGGDSLALGIWQLGFTALFSGILSVLFEQPRWPQASEEWLAVFALGIFCSALGFVMQVVAQQHTTATDTSLIFSLEPVFAAGFGFAFLGEVLSVQGYFGAALVLIGVIYPQLCQKETLQDGERNHALQSESMSKKAVS
ncbi:DMT family transporter [uncultured Anaeromusa sp.]|uniref:DMT family transporter n=1 Tax=uncultured Anaeromusa sp. TaxID=673273 RepID=UPI0029C67D46|nr:DMT family transporter [uncultured Anaeromusa sp.]